MPYKEPRCVICHRKIKSGWFCERCNNYSKHFLYMNTTIGTSRVNYFFDFKKEEIVKKKNEKEEIEK